MLMFIQKLEIYFIFSAVFIQSASSQTTNATCYVKGPSYPTCLDKYAVIPGHMNCLPPQRIGTVHHIDDNERSEILTAHNNVRSSVTPKAANMNFMAYSKGLEGSARRWSERCTYEPMLWHQRTTPGAFHTGMNTLLSDRQLNWTELVMEWEKEQADFTYNGTNDKMKVYNYTQMIWAESATVGCSWSQCGTKYFYVCFYAPILDESRFNTPYISSANSCGMCPSNCNSNGTNALCDCIGKTCLGGSKLNVSTCECSCIAEVHTYNGTLCDLYCDKNGDDPQCSTPPWTKDTCWTYLDTTFRCPWMCNVCPYADVRYLEGSVPLPWEEGLLECTSSTSSSTRLASSKSSPSVAHPQTTIANSHNMSNTNGSLSTNTTSVKGGKRLKCKRNSGTQLKLINICTALLVLFMTVNQGVLI